MTPRPPHRLNAGFTLAEMMIASAVALIILGTVLSFSMSVQTVGQRSTSEADRLQLLQGIGAVVGDDIRQARIIQDNLLPPTWLPNPNATSNLTLTLAPTSSCAQRLVTYTILPAERLPETLWLKRIGNRPGTQAITRTERCGLNNSTRLLAEGLTDASFAVALIGQNTFTTTPSPATYGQPYQAAQLRAAALSSQDGRRTPKTGTMNFTYTSQAIQ